MSRTASSSLHFGVQAKHLGRESPATDYLEHHLSELGDNIQRTRAFGVNYFYKYKQLRWMMKFWCASFFLKWKKRYWCTCRVNTASARKPWLMSWMDWRKRGCDFTIQRSFIDIIVIHLKVAVLFMAVNAQFVCHLVSRVIAFSLQFDTSTHNIQKPPHYWTTIFTSCIYISITRAVISSRRPGLTKSQWIFHQRQFN
jgi:hypothetical protein